MRLLFLAHRIPYPPNKGEKIRSFNILRHLAARHEVHLAALVDDPADAATGSGLRPMVNELLVERIDVPWRKHASLSALLDGNPVTLRYFYSPRLQARIDDLLDRIPVDAVFCSSSPMAEFVFRSRHAAALQVRSYMDLIDVDSRKWEQIASRSPLWSAWLYKREARLLSSYERRLASQFRHLLVVSEEERKCFPGAPPANLHVVANGVDLEHFFPDFSPATPIPGPAVVFTGVMDYWPNIDGIKWFVDNIWRLVLKAEPAARLYIVGSRPTREILRLASVPGVTITGHVRDVRDYVGCARVCIAPLRLARGVQNKVLEAMAMGRPIVVTPEASEGIQAENGRDFLVAAGETAFAEAVVRLLRDAELARTMGNSARRSMETGYQWSSNLGRLDELGL